jgi:hypothetical protein
MCRPDLSVREERKSGHQKFRVSQISAGELQAEIWPQKMRRPDLSIRKERKSGLQEFRVSQISAGELQAEIWPQNGGGGNSQQKEY